jgi:hypothetical protein
MVFFKFVQYKLLRAIRTLDPVTAGSIGFRQQTVQSQVVLTELGDYVVDLLCITVGRKIFNRLLVLRLKSVKMEKLHYAEK